MATDPEIALVEHIIQYDFMQKHLLKLALTAAGAEDDHHDGNRSLARLGQATVQLAIVDNGYENSQSREEMNKLQVLIDSKARLAAIARYTGIVGCIKLCRLSGKASPTVMSRAMRAIIGAAWKDSCSLDTVSKIIHNLQSLSNELPDGVNAPVPSTDDKPSLGYDIDLSRTSQLASISVTESTLGSGEIILPSCESENPCHSDSIVPVDNSDFGTRLGTSGYPSPLTTTACDDDINQWVTLEYALSQASYDNSAKNHDEMPLVESAAEDSLTRTVAGILPTASISISETFQNHINEGDFLSHYSSNETAEHHRRKRRKVSHRSKKGGWLDFYFACEQDRCARHRVSAPQQNFLSRPILDELVQMKSSCKNDYPLVIAAGIGSAQSVAALRDTIEALRTGPSPYMPSPGVDISAPERFRAIEEAEKGIAKLKLVKRCHIFRLWEDHCQAPLPEKGLIFLGVQNALTPKRPGNPQNSKKQSSAQSLLRLVSPNLGEESSKYQEQLAKIKKLEKLGRRLSMLSRRFGHGVLGLIQGPVVETISGTPVEISDEMLITPSENDFDRLLDCIERSQGDLIKCLSVAVAPIVHCILHGTMKAAGPFPLEQFHSSEILELPKVSKALLLAIYGQREMR